MISFSCISSNLPKDFLTLCDESFLNICFCHELLHLLDLRISGTHGQPEVDPDVDFKIVNVSFC